MRCSFSSGISAVALERMNAGNLERKRKKCTTP